MRSSTLFFAVFAASAPVGAMAAEDVSIERGLYLSVIGGCHDCHTEGYGKSGGKIEPDAALKGRKVPMRGPWGATYPMNLRITVSTRSEDEFVSYAKTVKTRPPMPWYNMHAMHEGDVRSLYRYIKSLGEPGEQVPDALPPGEEPAAGGG
jgi:hypothetical protein